MQQNGERLQRILRCCALCPRRCGVDRTGGAVGKCRVGTGAVVASYGPHFGEESILVGTGGSGTIFFSGCNLGCVFCQNHDISQDVCGQKAQPDELAGIMLELQRRGCENVNLVTPTHVAHAVAEALVLARQRGLSVPAVYNCGGYESVAVLRLLEWLIQIYMPDFKWADGAAGLRYSGVSDYPRVAEAALKEMYRQVGPIELNARHVARRGLLVRHLVMPQDLANSRGVLQVIFRVAPRATINVMGQYRPAHRAFECPELLRTVGQDETLALRRYAAELGLTALGE